MQRKPEPCCGLAPLLHGILDNTGRDRSFLDLAQPACVTGMTLAVGLGKVRPHKFEPPDQIVGGAFRADRGVLGAGVEIIVKSEVTRLPVPMSAVNHAITPSQR